MLDGNKSDGGVSCDIYRELKKKWIGSRIAIGRKRKTECPHKKETASATTRTTQQQQQRWVQTQLPYRDKKKKLEAST